MELCQLGFLGENIWYVISSATMLYNVRVEFNKRFSTKRKTKFHCGFRSSSSGSECSALRRFGTFRVGAAVHSISVGHITSEHTFQAERRKEDLEFIKCILRYQWRRPHWAPAESRHVEIYKMIREKLNLTSCHQ